MMLLESPDTILCKRAPVRGRDGTMMDAALTFSSMGTQPRPWDDVICTPPVSAPLISVILFLAPSEVRCQLLSCSNTSGRKDRMQLALASCSFIGMTMKNHSVPCNELPIKEGSCHPGLKRILILVHHQKLFQGSSEVEHGSCHQLSPVLSTSYTELIRNDL